MTVNYGVPGFDTRGVEERSGQSPLELVLGCADLGWRHRRLIAKSVAVCLVLAAVYIVVTPKQYLATAEMVIDPRKTEEFTTQQSAPMGSNPVDTAVVDSEGAVLGSENVALAVIKKLKLVDDPTFSKPTIVGDVLTFVSGIFGGDPTTDYKKLRSTVEDFEKRLTVKRIGVTYVFDISFLSPDPKQAAEIANAVAAAYVDDVLKAKYDSRIRAAQWMQARLTALGEQATSAEQAVADFKRQNGIVDTGGRLLDEQQVAELQSQLSLARANESNAKAKLDRIDQVLSSGKLDFSVTDAGSNEVIVNLKNSYADMSKRESDLSARLGRNHDAPKQLRADMDHVRSSILEELRRIGEGYKSDYEVARSQEDGLTAALDKAVRQSAITNSAQVKLNQLKSEAESYRALYDTFLQKEGEAVQQQSFPLTETRVVTAASAPLKKSQPKTLLVIAGSIFLGSLAGLGIGFIRDKTDRTLRSGRQVEEVADSIHITNVPLVDVRRGGDITREVLERPLSAFTEAIRELRVMTELHRVEHQMRVIGFASAVPGEGKTTIAVALATLMAKSRARIAIIDCDIRNPSLSHLVRPTRTGLVEVLTGQCSLGDAIQVDPLTNVSVLPVASDGPNGDSSDLVSSPQMKALLDQMRELYDLVIVDLPPLMAVIDTKASAMFFDGFVLVAEWGKTSSETLAEALKMSGRVKDRLLGVVLNKVDARVVARHRGNYLSAA